MKALLVAVLLLPLALAATASAPAQHPAVRTLVSSPRPIYAFAQDGDRLLRPEPTWSVGRRVVNGGHGPHHAHIAAVSRDLLKAANRP